ncbi:MAG TPA: hypothetical protein VM490_10490 [Armatimonadaceae bacterium]|nr:hypothetical protein [Armatimonadaceae bacterium]
MSNTRRFSAAKVAASAALVAASLLCGGGVARADVKMVSTTTVSGLPAGQAPPKPMAITTYYKGEMQRTENGDAVTIFDCAKDLQYVLDGKKKTYYVTSMKDAMAAAASNPFLAMVKFDTSVDLKPGDKTKEIAGKKASLYNYTAVIKMSMDGSPELAAMLPTITLQGEQWTTEDFALPANCAKMRGGQMLRSMRATLGKGAQDIADKLATMKGSPLSSKVVVTVKANADLPGVPKDPIVTTTEVTSVSEEALADALFAVPADYKKVDPPAAPGPGGFPGAGAPPPAAG